MIARQPGRIAERMQAAITELQNLVLSRYPTATFTVVGDPDEPRAIDIVTTVDVDDPDEVGDFVMDRVLDLQVEEGLPVHVLPISTPERAAAIQAREREQNERDGDGGYARRLAELAAIRQRTP